MDSMADKGHYRFHLLHFIYTWIGYRIDDVLEVTPGVYPLQVIHYRFYVYGILTGSDSGVSGFVAEIWV